VQPARQKDIRILDLASKSVSILPESTGMFSPRWSPDGRYIAAMTLDQHRLMVFDRNTSKWSVLAEGLLHNPVWARDGKYVYFQALQEDEVPSSASPSPITIWNASATGVWRTRRIAYCSGARAGWRPYRFVSVLWRRCVWRELEPRQVKPGMQSDHLLLDSI